MGGAGALAALRVVAPALQQGGAELLLQRLRQIERGGGGVHRRGSHLLQQRRQALAQGREQRLQPGTAHLGLVGLGEHLPGAPAHGLGGRQLTRLLAAQADELLQGRREGREITGPPRLLPEGIAAGLGPGQGGDQGRIQAALPLQLQAQQLQLAADGGRGGCAQGGLRLPHQLRVLRARLAPVQLGPRAGPAALPPARGAPGGAFPCSGRNRGRC